MNVYVHTCGYVYTCISACAQYVCMSMCVCMYDIACDTCVNSHDSEFIYIDTVTFVLNMCTYTQMYDYAHACVYIIIVHDYVSLYACIHIGCVQINANTVYINVGTVYKLYMNVYTTAQQYMC